MVLCLAVCDSCPLVFQAVHLLCQPGIKVGAQAQGTYGAYKTED